MKFEINDENSKRQTLTLSLIRVGDYIYLNGTELNGLAWNLLWFDSDGKVHRCKGIRGSSGLELDDKGRLIIKE